MNRKPGIDTFERYLYIHGTRNEHRNAWPLLHGGVGMKIADVISLFGDTPEGMFARID